MTASDASGRNGTDAPLCDFPDDSERRGAPDRIRTCGLRLRRPTLYPAELRAQTTPAICDSSSVIGVRRSIAFTTQCSQIARQDLDALATSEASCGATKAVGRAPQDLLTFAASAARCDATKNCRACPLQDLPTFAASAASCDVTKNCRACPTRVARWRARQDLNLRPTDSKSGALSN